MRLAIVSQQGGKAAGAEHALMEFVQRLPPSVQTSWFFFEDGDFARSVRKEFRSVTIVAMSNRVAEVKRQRLPISAVADVANLVYRLAAALRDNRPDVVLTNSMKAHIVGSLAAKAAGLACINYVHDIVEGPALALLRLVSGTCAQERLTCSLAVKKQINLPRTSVAYAAIQVENFGSLPGRREARAALGIPDPDRPVVAIVGRVARWKRQDQFIRMAARVARRSNAYFCIIGSPLFGVDPGYVEELEEMVVREGLRERLMFIPWQEDMRTVYAAIDVSCNCSLREPFGRTSLEALASGVPIVCFDDAGICEIFEQHGGGTRVPAGDEAAFAESVLAYVSDAALTAATGLAARSAAQTLDIRFAYPRFLSVIDRVGNRKSGSGALSGAGPPEPPEPASEGTVAADDRIGQRSTMDAA